MTGTTTAPKNPSWRPGDYLTGQYNLPMGITMLETLQLVPVGLRLEVAILVNEGSKVRGSCSFNGERGVRAKKAIDDSLVFLGFTGAGGVQ